MKEWRQEISRVGECADMSSSRGAGRVHSVSESPIACWGNNIDKGFSLKFAPIHVGSLRPRRERVSTCQRDALATLHMR